MCCVDLVGALAGAVDRPETSHFAVSDVAVIKDLQKLERLFPVGKFI
jgi:hypothetical protein